MPVMEMSSVFDQRVRVKIDPWGRNPLADDARQLAAGVPLKGAPPKMFMGGTADLPVFTSTGLDPSQLLKLPYQCRHYAAAEKSLDVVHGIFEQHATNPHASMTHQGLTEALGRVRDWMFGVGEYDYAAEPDPATNLPATGRVEAIRQAQSWAQRGKAV